MDSGCSDAVMRDGVPGVELHGVCTEQGPITCFGVGGIQISAKQEWIVKLKKKDGNYQLVKGLTMDQVCSPMPIVNTEQAVAQLKQSDPSNTELQNCHVPAEIGGMVDIIVGIKYNNIGPKVIHTLESGLAIYSINLETHNPKFNAAIGGPHSSFSAMVNQNGGFTKVSQTLQILYTKLDNFRRFGPPRIPHIPLLSKEREFASELFHDEFELPEEVKIFDDDSEDEENVLGTEPEPEDSSTVISVCVEEGEKVSTVDPAIAANMTLKCSICCINVSAEDDKLRDLKFWFKQMESGTSVEYRCPSCRDCSKCKDSDNTDKISLREEVERKAIEDSIAFDRENKRIIVSLPKRGKEEFFLSSNRDIAMKVFKKVCEKASKSPEMKKEINAAFDKLFKNEHAVPLKDIDKERLKQFITKAVQHYLPWRVIYKSDSITTPCRPVFDASTNTRKRPDGLGGGRSLNDLLCKGRISTLNILRMMIRFIIGAFAFTGDLQQFYCACKLLAEEFNLTRFLYHPDLDPNAEPEEYLFQALTFGLKSASGQSESVKTKLANEIREEEPELASLLEWSTYVDDMGDSKGSLDEVEMLITAADSAFAELGLKCKHWTKTGDKPSEIVSDNGVSVLIGGCEWFPKLDSVSTRIPRLHFGKRRRGKLDKDTEFFHATGDQTTDIQELDKFCPKLTRRVCASKAASIFDIWGLLAPALSGVKCLMRETVKATESWDDEIPSDLRNKWLLAFLRLENLRGIAFDRPVMPKEAISRDLRLIGLSDAAKPVIMVGVWGGFELPDGSFSCRLIIGRSILASDTTIPKLELAGACSVANLGWVVRTALKGWPSTYIQGSDSTISLCWIISEQLRLAEFHRNIVVQVRRAVELPNLFHVKTEVMVADCGTRPEKVKVEDVMAGARWHNGEAWMTWPVERSIAEGLIKPALDLKMNEDDRDEFKEGIIFEKVPEVLTRGHNLNLERISKIEERAQFSKYVLVPTKYGFKKSFRIVVIIIKFIVKCRKSTTFTGSKLSSPMKKIPTIFTSVVPAQQEAELHDLLDIDQMGQEETCMKLAATYMYRTTTAEVKQFNKAENIKKMSMEFDDILYSKNRLLESMEFKTITGMEMVNLDPLGVNVKTPLVDRYSPYAYAFAQYIHYEVAGHAGLETCNRLSLERIFIIQGISLYREISVECIKCKIKRKRFLEMSMGPVGDHHLNIAPPFYACQADLFGPVAVYAPGASKDLRGRPAKSCKVWCLVFACPVTRLINCQVVERSDHSGVLDGITRLAAEVGFPKYLMVDQDGAVMKGLREAKVSLRDLQHKIYVEHGVVFSTCPVGGHNQHGQVERVIKSVQELLDDCDVKNKRLHATGFQTLLKLVENNYNSLPLGFSYDRSLNNTPMLKIITPNFFKIGRNNDRALEGPVEMPKDGSELLEKVNETYKGLFKLWADVYVPKLVYQPKWYKDDKDLNEGDLVYMQKAADNVLSSQWIIGMIEQVIRSRDGKVRRVLVKYHNASEREPRLTDRAVRGLIKIFDIDEYILQEDLAELIRRLDDDKTAPKPDEKEEDDPDSQVASSSLNQDYLDRVNSSSVSGTWLRLPVPINHSHLLGGGGNLLNEDHEVPVVVGDRCQVPVEDVETASKPYSDTCHVTPHPGPQAPVKNPYFYPVLVQNMTESTPMAVSNVVSALMMGSFDLATKDVCDTYGQDDDYENRGLMQILHSTDLNVDFE